MTAPKRLTPEELESALDRLVKALPTRGAALRGHTAALEAEIKALREVRDAAQSYRDRLEKRSWRVLIPELCAALDRTRDA